MGLGRCRDACCGLACRSTLGPKPEDSSPLVFTTSNVSGYLACGRLPSWATYSQTQYTRCLFTFLGVWTLQYAYDVPRSMCNILRWTSVLLFDHSCATSVNQLSFATLFSSPSVKPIVKGSHPNVERLLLKPLNG